MFKYKKQLSKLMIIVMLFINCNFNLYSSFGDDKIELSTIKTAYDESLTTTDAATKIKAVEDLKAMSIPLPTDDPHNLNDPLIIGFNHPVVLEDVDDPAWSNMAGHYGLDPSTEVIIVKNVSDTKAMTGHLSINPENNKEVIIHLSDQLEAGTTYLASVKVQNIKSTLNSKRYTDNYVMARLETKPISDLKAMSIPLPTGDPHNLNDPLIIGFNHPVVLEDIDDPAWSNMAGHYGLDPSTEVIIVKNVSDTKAMTGHLSINPENNKEVIIHLSDQLEAGTTYLASVKVQNIKSTLNGKRYTDNYVMARLETKVNIQTSDLELKLKTVFRYNDNYYNTFQGVSMNNGIIYAVRNYRDNNVKLAKLFALDLYGHLIWEKVILNASVGSSVHKPIYDNSGNIYIQVHPQSEDGNITTNLVCSFTPEGLIRWSEELSNWMIINNPPSLIEDGIIVGNTNGITKLNRDSGHTTWSYQTDLENYKALEYRVSNNGTIVVLYTNHKDNIVIEIIDSNGKLIKSSKTNDWGFSLKFKSFQLTSDNKLILVDSNGILRSIDLTTLKVTSDYFTKECDLKKLSELYKIIKVNESSIHMAIDSNDYLYITIYEMIGNRQNLLVFNKNGQLRYNNYYDLEHQDDYRPIMEIDSKGIAYYTLNSSGLAGSYNIYALNELGQVADKIAIGGSSIARPTSIVVYEDVLIAGIGHDAKVVAAQIIREDKQRPSKIEFINDNIELGLGLEETIPFVVYSDKDKIMLVDDYNWTSENTDIIEITKDNKLIGKKTGDATIELRVTSSGHTVRKRINVSVIKKESIPVSVEIICKDSNYNLINLIVETGKPVEFEAIVKDQYNNIIPNEKVRWTSLMNLHECMSQKGVFKSSIDGAFNIFAISLSNPLSKCNIRGKVVNNKLIFDNIKPSSLVLREECSTELYPLDQYGKAIDTSADDAHIIWTSEDTSVASINGNLLTAHKTGVINILGTFSSNEIAEKTIKKKLVVVPSFNLDRTIKTGNSEYVAIDNDGSLFISDIKNNYIVAMSSNDDFLWKTPIVAPQNIYISENSIYVTNDVSSKSALFRIDKNSGQIIWRNNILESNSKIYTTDSSVFSISAHELKAFSFSGELLWEKIFDEEIVSHHLDSENRFVLTLSSYAKLENIEISLDGKEKNRSLIYGKKGDLIQSEDNDYALNFIAINVDGIESIIKLYEDVKQWQYDMPKNQRISKRCLSIDKKHIFSSLGPMNNGYIYCLDSLGQEVWKLDLSKYSSNGTRTANYLLTIDGVLYAAITESEKIGYNYQPTKSYLQAIDIETGSILKQLEFDISLYGEFIKLHNVRNNVVLETEKRTDDNQRFLLMTSQDGHPNYTPSIIRLKAPSNSLMIHESMTISSVVENNIGIVLNDEDIIYLSGDESILTINKNGLITGKSIGKTYIDARLKSNADIHERLEINVLDKEAYRQSLAYIKEQKNKIISFYQHQGLPDSDWVAIALNAAKEDLNNPIYKLKNKSYADVLKNQIQANPDLGLLTEYARISIAVLATKNDPFHISGENLIEAICNNTDYSQGNNAPIWALIALNAANKDKNDFISKKQNDLVDYLLNNKSDKGWALAGDSSDTDITGMAIYALAPYYNSSAKVKASIDEAIEWLAMSQHSNGSFSPSATESERITVNTESTAQAILALVSVGIDPQSAPFIKSNGNPVSALLSNQLENGSFGHIDNKMFDGLATNQALQALAALDKFYTSSDRNGQLYYNMPFNSSTKLLKRSIKLDKPSELTDNTEYNCNNDVVIRFAKDSINNKGTLKITEKTSSPLPQQTIKKSGSIVDISIENSALTASVELEMSVSDLAFKDKSAIYYYNPTKKMWIYQPTKFIGNHLFTIVDHFSTYGVLWILRHPKMLEVI